MKKQTAYAKVCKVLSILSTALGVLFGFLWSVNRVVSLCGLAVSIVAAIALIVVYSYLAKKESDTELFARVSTDECACVELACSLTREQMEKYRKNRCFDLILHGKQLDPQIVVRVQEFSSTGEEDAAYRESKLGTAAVSLVHLVQLQNVSFVVPRKLYETIQQIADCAAFLQNNTFAVYDDVWLSKVAS